MRIIPDVIIINTIKPENTKPLLYSISTSGDGRYTTCIAGDNPISLPSKFPC